MAKFTTECTSIPYLGSGLGYRRELKAGIFAAREQIDFLEIIAEQFFDNEVDAMDELHELCASFTVIPHGLGLSIGSAAPVDEHYLRSIKRISDFTESPYYSDHLCLSRSPGIDIGHLSPIWFTKAVLQITIEKVRRIQDFLERPLILENVTYPFDIPGADMSQTEFFQKLVDSTGCGMLLDVTNVHINSVNHTFDALEFLKGLPLSSVIQVHLAGGSWEGDILVDEHSEPVSEESWALFTQLTDLTPIRGALVEYDTNFPEEMEDLIRQVERAREIMWGSQVRFPPDRRAHPSAIANSARRSRIDRGASATISQ